MATRCKHILAPQCSRIFPVRHQRDSPPALASQPSGYVRCGRRADCHVTLLACCEVTSRAPSQSAAHGAALRARSWLDLTSFAKQRGIPKPCAASQEVRLNVNLASGARQRMCFVCL